MLRIDWFKWVILTGVYFYALVIVLDNDTRKLLGQNSIWDVPRQEQYFITRMALFEPYSKISTILSEKQFSKVGFISGGDSWEYPLWNMNSENKDFSLQHILVRNESVILNQDKKPFVPESIIATYPEFLNKEVIHFGEKKYDLFFNSENVSLYLPQ
jgi:hypothetical protein